MEAVISSATSALEIALLGKVTSPETYKFVEVRLVVVAEVAVRLVMVVVTRAVIPETYKFVEVRLVLVTLVNIAVEAEEAPMAVPLILPAVMVRVPSTMASVTELAGKDKAPETYRLVVVRLVVVTEIKIPLVDETKVK